MPSKEGAHRPSVLSARMPLSHVWEQWSPACPVLCGIDDDEPQWYGIVPLQHVRYEWPVCRVGSAHAQREEQPMERISVECRQEKYYGQGSNYSDPLHMIVLVAHKGCIGAADVHNNCIRIRRRGFDATTAPVCFCYERSHAFCECNEIS